MKRLLLTLIFAAAGLYLGHASRGPGMTLATAMHPHFVRRATLGNNQYAAATAAAPEARFEDKGGTLPRFVANDALFRAIDSAKQSVLVSAYNLSPNATIISHLAAADARGVRVQVILTGDGFDYAVNGNRAFAATHPTMHVVLLQRPIHLKTVVTDHGAGVFVTDRNFASRGDLVLELPAAYALPLERAAIGDPHDDPPLTVTKGTSLDTEAALIDRARYTVSIETESFGSNNPVATAIEGALRRGVRVHLVVAAREYDSKASEQRFVSELQREGAIFNTSTDDQKLAIIDRNTGWVGSSNATAMLRDQIDWGFTTQDSMMLNEIQTSINQDSGYAAARQ